MIVIPAIDVLDGRCVRLKQGDYGRSTVYDDEPQRRAQQFAGAGAARVHLVDLDSARGQPQAHTTAALLATVKALLELGVEVQLGGGIRSAEDAVRWIDAGVTNVIIGSLALREPQAVEGICAQWPGRVLLALDVRGGNAMADGWLSDGGDAMDHLRRWNGLGTAGVVVTDVERDGLLTGASLELLRRSAEIFQGPVIASGGVAAMDDLDACASLGMHGVVLGRALYERRVDLADALARFPRGGAA
jgi:phosphoribosylformimino-5-aminoimidazole carboxamide ribotide isomerase